MLKRGSYRWRDACTYMGVEHLDGPLTAIFARKQRHSPYLGVVQLLLRIAVELWAGEMLWRSRNSNQEFGPAFRVEFSPKLAACWPWWVMGQPRIGAGSYVQAETKKVRPKMKGSLMGVARGSIIVDRNRPATATSVRKQRGNCCAWSG
jgi:hypothetical protein